jgi:recombination protein RecT
MSKTETAVSVTASEKNITTQVLGKVNQFVESKELTLPNDYSPENALKSAYLVLSESMTRDNKPVLEACTRESIANALLKMIVQGLSVVKNQCYFIPYGDKLTFSRSYLGAVALAKRIGNVNRVVPVVIYEGDDFEFEIDTETGFKHVLKHGQKLQNIDNSKILGAYAVVHYSDGTKNTEIMTMEEVRAAWNQGQMKGNSPAHKNFTQEMVKKTVIARACKEPISTSNDANLYTDEDKAPTVKEIVAKEIETATEEIETVVFKDAKLIKEPVSFEVKVSDNTSVAAEVAETKKAISPKLDF